MDSDAVGTGAGTAAAVVVVGGDRVALFRRAKLAAFAILILVTIMALLYFLLKETGKLNAYKAPRNT
jgi:hypothetical protein